MENIFKDAKTIDSLIAQAIGAGSVAWNPRPAGVFKSEHASMLVDHALLRLNELLQAQFQAVLDQVESDND